MMFNRVKTRVFLTVFILLSIPWVAVAGARLEAVDAWQDLRFGMFIHWGLYSVSGGVWKGEEIETGYSEQILAWSGASRKEYAELASDFTVPKSGAWRVTVEVFRPESEGLIEIGVNETFSRYKVLPEESHRDIVLVDAGSFLLDNRKPSRVSVQPPDYSPGNPLGVSLAGIRFTPVFPDE